MKLEGAVFDLDGTLTDSGEGIMNAVRYTLERYEKTATEAQLRSFIGPPLQTQFQQFLNVSEEEYYETGKTGTISGLSKTISSIEEDLNFFIKHVFLYTDKMNNDANQYIGEFNALCKKYLTIENFEQYKNEIEESYLFDFLMNLFIKFPFLKIGEYMRQNQEG